MKKGLLLGIIGTLLLTGCQSSTKEESVVSTSETETSVTVSTVSFGDNEMEYTKFGNGNKYFIILPGLSVHSVMGSAEAIAQSYADFTEEYTVYVFDRPKNMSEGYTIRDIAEDTENAMKELGIESADIFGASQGGMIAEYIAIDHPELVNKMILGSSLAKPNTTFTNLVNEWIQLAEEKNEEGLLESFADNVYSEATLEVYRDTLIESNKGITDEEYERFLIQAKSCLTFNCYDELSSIQCPVLVLGSKGDKVVTVEGSQEMADVLNCEIYLYDENYGHGVYDEATDYKQRCLDFLLEK